VSSDDDVRPATSKRAFTLLALPVPPFFSGEKGAQITRHTSPLTLSLTPHTLNDCPSDSTTSTKRSAHPTRHSLVEIPPWCPKQAPYALENRAPSRAPVVSTTTHQPAAGGHPSAVPAAAPLRIAALCCCLRTLYTRSAAPAPLAAAFFFCLLRLFCNAFRSCWGWG